MYKQPRNIVLSNGLIQMVLRYAKLCTIVISALMLLIAILPLFYTAILTVQLEILPHYLMESHILDLCIV